MENIKHRYFELDLARGLVVLLLPFLHVFEVSNAWEFSTPELQQTLSWIECTCIAVPAVFMVVMGMNIAFSGRTDAKSVFRRGVYLLVASYVLNIFRSLAPAVVVCLVSEAADWQSVKESLTYLIAPDIMTFAGMAFLTLAFFTYLNFTKTKMLFVAIVLLAINESLANVEYHCPYLCKVALGSFVWTDDTSFFPLFSWLIFPVYGYFIADHVMNTVPENLRAFWRKLAFVSMVIVTLMWGIIPCLGMDFWLVAVPPLNHYITSPMTVVIDVCAANVVIYLGYEIYHWLNLKSFNEQIQAFSENLNAFYMIHWIIIGAVEFTRLGMGHYGSADIGRICYLFMSVGLCVVSAIIAPYFRRYILHSAEEFFTGFSTLERRVEKDKTESLNFVSVLLWKRFIH